MKVCPLCGSEFNKCFTGKILNRHEVQYYQCTECNFLQTENPYWLAEAYSNVMNQEDTGMLKRNIRFSQLTSIIINSYFNQNALFVDYAGGYGIFTRLMRDLGYDYYWYDPFAQNILARGFEYQKEKHKSIELLTCFESFEHFSSPIVEMEKMISISKNILFSTQFLPEPTPKIDKWWYYGLEHGQHVSFYTGKACQSLAIKFGLHFYSFGELHLISQNPINKVNAKCIVLLERWGMIRYLQSKRKSKVEEDYFMLGKKRNNEGYS
jgi:hypothetical protein